MNERQMSERPAVAGAEVAFSPSPAGTALDEGFTRVCSLDDVPEVGAIRVLVDGMPVAIVRSDGQVYAIHDVCSHANVALSEGDVEGTTLECWLHGSRFDLRTGAPIGLPATRPVPVYPVAVVDEQVFVQIPAPSPSSTPSPSSAPSKEKHA